MAVRSAIDIYGENVRTLGTIDSPVFGEVMKFVPPFRLCARTSADGSRRSVWVGAMLVATTVLTKKEGEEVKRGDEVRPRPCPHCPLLTPPSRLATLPLVDRRSSRFTPRGR